MRLIARLHEAEAENRRLRAEIEFLRGNPAIAKGLQGESLVARLLSAGRSKRGSGHDIECREQQLLIEVKYSSLLNAIGSRPIRRWVWTKLFGESGNKRYHRLLLVGDADPRFAEAYADPSSPYVIFDLPYEAAVQLVGGVKPGRTSRIHLTTSPATVLSPRALTLFNDFQLSASELLNRYPRLQAVARGEI